MKYKVYARYGEDVNIASFESFTDAFVYLIIMRPFLFGAYVMYNRRIVFRLNEYITWDCAQRLREKELYISEVLCKPVTFVSNYLNQLKIK